MISILPPIRGTDAHGSGWFGASRSGYKNGKHIKYKHPGVDFCSYKGSIIVSPHSGTVTKIGYPYSPNDQRKGHLRYVQITEHGKYRCRYFYVVPYEGIKVGDNIVPGKEIGITQGLVNIYPSITDHFHFEVIEGVRNFLDPLKYLKGEI